MRFSWNVKLWSLACYIAKTAVSLLLQVKQWAREENHVTVMFSTNCQFPRPALDPNQILCKNFGERRGILNSLKFSKKQWKAIYCRPCSHNFIVLSTHTFFWKHIHQKWISFFIPFFFFSEWHSEVQTVLISSF